MLMRMRNLGTIAYYELLRMLRVKETFWLLLFMPILLIFILGNALSSAFTVEDSTIEIVKVGVYSPEQVNSAYVDILYEEQLSEWIDPTAYDTREGLLTALNERDISYGLVVPNDFAEQVNQQGSAQWELFPGNNDTDNITGQAIIESILQQINFIQASTIVMNDPQAAMTVIAEGSSGIANEYVQVVRPHRADQDFSAIQYYGAAMLVMFLLYTGMTTALSLVEEKSTHTLDRLYAAPIEPYIILIGKMLAGGLIALCQAIIIILVTKLGFGVDWGVNYVALLYVCMAIVIASISLAVIVTAFTSNAKTVQSIFTFIIMAMTFLSGGFSPDIGDFLGSLGQFTLSQWASRSLLHIMMDSPSSLISHHLTVLGMIAIGLFLLSAVLGRKAVSHE